MSLRSLLCCFHPCDIHSMSVLPSVYSVNLVSFSNTFYWKPIFAYHSESKWPIKWMCFVIITSTLKRTFAFPNYALETATKTEGDEWGLMTSWLSGHFSPLDDSCSLHCFTTQQLFTHLTQLTDWVICIPFVLCYPHLSFLPTRESIRCLCHH